jgi:GPN-loop GTPase
LVKFSPLDINDEDSINDILCIIDNIIQYGEDLDVKEPKEYDRDEIDNEENDDED